MLLDGMYTDELILPVALEGMSCLLAGSCPPLVAAEIATLLGHLTLHNELRTEQAVSRLDLRLPELLASHLTAGSLAQAWTPWSHQPTNKEHAANALARALSHLAGPHPEVQAALKAAPAPPAAAAAGEGGFLGRTAAVMGAGGWRPAHCESMLCLVAILVQGDHEAAREVCGGRHGLLPAVVKALSLKKKWHETEKERLRRLMAINYSLQLLWDIFDARGSAAPLLFAEGVIDALLRVLCKTGDREQKGAAAEFIRDAISDDTPACEVFLEHRRCGFADLIDLLRVDDTPPKAWACTAEALCAIARDRAAAGDVIVRCFAPDIVCSAVWGACSRDAGVKRTGLKLLAALAKLRRKLAREALRWPELLAALPQCVLWQVSVDEAEERVKGMLQAMDRGEPLDPQWAGNVHADLSGWQLVMTCGVPWAALDVVRALAIKEAPVGGGHGNHDYTSDDDDDEDETDDDDDDDDEGTSDDEDDIVRADWFGLGGFVVSKVAGRVPGLMRAVCELVVHLNGCALDYPVGGHRLLESVKALHLLLVPYPDGPDLDALVQEELSDPEPDCLAAARAEAEGARHGGGAGRPSGVGPPPAGSLRLGLTRALTRLLVPGMGLGHLPVWVLVAGHQRWLREVNEKLSAAFSRAEGSRRQAGSRRQPDGPGRRQQREQPSDVDQEQHQWIQRDRRCESCGQSAWGVAVHLRRCPGCRDVF